MKGTNLVAISSFTHRSKRASHSPQGEEAPRSTLQPEVRHGKDKNGI